MKEELLKLKDSASKIIEQKSKLKNKINLFNLKVEEKKEELGIDDFFNLESDSYNSACFLDIAFPEIQQIVSSIRKEHPKYGEKRIKELTIVELNKNMGNNHNLILLKDELDTIVDCYFLYENCGFFKIKELENSISELEGDAKEGLNSILGESKEVAKKAGSSVVNVVKPYGDIAKSQLNDVKNNTKKLINTGSKKLINVLKNIENKTK